MATHRNLLKWHIPYSYILHWKEHSWEGHRGAADRNIWHSPVKHGLPIHPEELCLPCPLGYPNWSLDYSAVLIIVIPQMAICSAHVGELAPGRSTQLPCILKSGQLHHCSLIAHDRSAIVYEPSVISSSLWLKILGKWRFQPVPQGPWHHSACTCCTAGWVPFHTLSAAELQAKLCIKIKPYYKG